VRFAGLKLIEQLNGKEQAPMSTLGVRRRTMWHSAMMRSSGRDCDDCGCVGMQAPTLRGRPPDHSATSMNLRTVMTAIER